MDANLHPVRDHLIEGYGLTPEELAGHEAALEDRAFSWLMPVLFTPAGRRAAAS